MVDEKKVAADGESVTKATTVAAAAAAAAPPTAEDSGGGGASVAANGEKDERTTAADASTTDSKVVDARSGDDHFTVKLKPQYVLTERHPTLTPMDEVVVRPDDKDKDKNGGGGERRRGQNRKRPRDARTPDAEKPCLSVVRGTPCPMGPAKCKYSHDMEALLASRVPDLTVPGWEDLKCPHYHTFGRCDFGIACRLGAPHLNLMTGENLCRSVEFSYERTNNALLFGTQSLNALTKDTQIKLRKNKYPFKTKRKAYCGKKKKADEDAAVEDESKGDHPSGDLSAVSPALAPRTRKLIDFRNKVYIAPLTTVGNLPFRRIMKRFGADITCGEMAVASNLLEGRPSEWALLRRHPCEDVFGVQIAAGFADQYTRCAELLQREVQCDFVDMNLGCPLDVICKKGAGAALMLREKRLREAVEGITGALDVPVTIKIRTGWDEKQPIAHNLVPRIQSWGIDGIGAIMLHGRSRLQRYSRMANWDYIHQVAQSQTTADGAKTIPVIGNGDVFDYTDHEEHLREHPHIHPTAMVGRGALVKPWLPTEIKEKRRWDISATERLDVLKDFVRFGLEHWGSDRKGVDTIRRFLLEWLSFLYRYVPVGLLEVVPQRPNQRPPLHTCGRSDLETLMMSKHCGDWIRLSEMLLGKVPDDFRFEPKHKASGYK